MARPGLDEARSERAWYVIDIYSSKHHFFDTSYLVPILLQLACLYLHLSFQVKDNKPDGLSVKLLPGNEEAFLPTGHLSDHPSLLQSLLLGLKPGSQLSKVLILNKKAKKIIVSAKSSLIAWTEGFETLPKATDFAVGDFLPCYIKDFQDYGCFVEAPNGMIGLCPKALLADHFVNNPREAYSVNQTVMCKITNIDVEKERFLVSLKMSDITDESLSGNKMYFLYIQNTTAHNYVHIAMLTFYVKFPHFTNSQALS